MSTAICENPLEEMVSPEEMQEPFAVDSLERVEWWLRRKGNIAAEKARIKAQAAKMVAELDADEKRLDFFAVEVQEVIKAELARRGGKKKSVTLLQGTCAFKTVPGGLRLIDPEAALTFAVIEAPQLVVQQPKLDTDAYRKLAQERLQEAGELIPGVEVAEDRESFSIKFKVDKEGEDNGAH